MAKSALSRIEWEGILERLVYTKGPLLRADDIEKAVKAYCKKYRLSYHKDYITGLLSTCTGRAMNAEEVNWVHFLLNIGNGSSERSAYARGPRRVDDGGTAVSQN